MAGKSRYTGMSWGGCGGKSETGLHDGAPYDVVVVGAGPAGSLAARVAAERGLSVLLLDKRAEIGRPVQCAEYVPRLIGRLVDVPPACIAQPTAALRTFLPGGGEHRMAAPGYVLQRALFDRSLAVAAVRAGAELLVRTRAVARTPTGLVVESGGERREIAARIIIGADGPHSTVGGWIGRRNTELLAAAQCELVLDTPGDETEVYFDPEYLHGYAWLFPKGATANVGVGLSARAAAGGGAARALEHFLARLQASGRLGRVQILGYSGGWIPTGGLLGPGEGNCMLAGDAAGCVHPITGAGILFALHSGRLCGEAAAEAVQKGDGEAAARYEARLQEVMGAAINRGLAARRRQVEHWTGDPARLDALVRETWVAFEEYGRYDGNGGTHGDQWSALS